MGLYDKITHEQFENKLEELVSRMSAGEILSVPGAYEALSEHLNNDVLDELAEELGLEEEDEDEEES